MDASVEEYVEGLLRPESLQTPSDSCKVDELSVELPPWFDEDKFNRGRKVYWEHCFSLTTSMLFGLVAVFSVPSILQVLVGSQRSSSEYTAYKRYLSTMMHLVSWFQHDLRPGSVSWRSLLAVRGRHLRAGLAARARGRGTVSQRDLALTQFGFFGFVVLKPDKFGIVVQRPDDWECYLYTWRVLGYMIGIQDKYNLSRGSHRDTRRACQAVLHRVYTPCMTSVPEYFEHMTEVMLNGLSTVNPALKPRSMLYWLRHLTDVPGYVYTDEERMALQETLRTHLKGRPEDTGVEASSLVSAPGIEGVFPSSRLLFVRDYDVLDSTPGYKTLTGYEKYKLATLSLLLSLCSLSIVRWCLNLNFRFSLFLMKYFPYMAFFKFGVKESFVNMFKESPVDDTKPLPNSEYHKNSKPVPWYKDWLSIIW